MTPEMNLTYEGFIRGAFSIDKEHLINRYEDPASLADTDVFNSEDIEVVKASTAYSMSIYKTHIINNCQGVSDDEDNDMCNMIKDVINATDKTIIYNLIKDFRNNYVEKYVIYKWMK